MPPLTDPPFACPPPDSLSLNVADACATCLAADPAASPCQNNLGGFGPTAGAAEIRYPGVGTLNGGQPVDMVVRVAGSTTYTPGATGANGCVGSGQTAMAQVNQLVTGSGTSEVDLSLSLEGAGNAPTGTFSLSFFDFDSGSNGVTEHLIIGGYTSYVLDPNTA
eukprot:gene1895-5205_t